ncbi:hypothetical protein C8K38_110209 [Rhodococcus sp. OK611]|nr:hypothetical protein C8K38_110209 [Rhodococcus sp. OK611]SNX91733.1 hypothetical protein SAMN05447004_11118 [Rhodococcus sp. OK270]
MCPRRKRGHTSCVEALDLDRRISGTDVRCAGATGTTGEGFLRASRRRGLTRIENIGIADVAGSLEGPLRVGRGLGLTGIENIGIADLARTLERALGRARRIDHRRHDNRLDNRLLHGMRDRSRGRQSGLRSDDGARISAVRTRIPGTAVLGTGIDWAGLLPIAIHRVLPLHLQRRTLSLARYGRADCAVTARRQGGDTGEREPGHGECGDDIAGSDVAGNGCLLGFRRAAWLLHPASGTTVAPDRHPRVIATHPRGHSIQTGGRSLLNWSLAFCITNSYGGANLRAHQ